MDLEYKIKGSTGKPQVVRVEFDPPLLSYDEVKPRLLSMKADADEALGTVRPSHPVPSHPLAASASSPSLPSSPPPQTPVITLIAKPHHRYRSKRRRSHTSKCRSKSGPRPPSSS